MSHQRLRQVGRSLFALAIDTGAVFHYARFPLYWGTLGRLRSALQLRDGERVLDVGCGTGIGVAVTRGTRAAYVGIDTDATYVRFARAQRGGSPCDFAEMSAADLGFVERAFDKAVVINVLHHLPEAALDRLLMELARVVRERVVLCDWATDGHNAISAFVARHDRGEHIRTRSELRRLLQRHYVVQHEEVFMNRLHIISQVLFTLAPRTV
jgi:SAM-dependent methyltransferase